MTQLCLALADLAAQFKEWKTVVQDVVDRFGGVPETGGCLLEFLKVLPEEMANNRLPLSVSLPLCASLTSINTPYYVYVIGQGIP